mmetsp:Transcript_2299/g.9011  ORF Transcript_2299/g.9011 Transcript_2299/m.9011 type:complete len:225 (-) Transcript_2299:1190-1864(-)
MITCRSAAKNIYTLAYDLQVLLLKKRERDDVANRRRIREKHDETIDAETHTRGRGHAVLERGDEIFIHFDVVRLVFERFEFVFTTRRRRFALRRARFRVRHHLRLEAFTLIDGIGQLAERVRELATDDEELEPFGDSRFTTVRFRERRNLERVVENERGLNQIAFARGFKHFVQHVTDACRQLDTFDAFPSFLRVRLERGNCRCLGSFQVIPERHDVYARGFLD